MDKENTAVEALFGEQKSKVLVKQPNPKRGDKKDLIVDFKKGLPDKPKTPIRKPDN